MATREAAQFYGQAESALRDEQFEARMKTDGRYGRTPPSTGGSRLVVIFGVWNRWPASFYRLGGVCSLRVL